MKVIFIASILSFPFLSGCAALFYTGFDRELAAHKIQKNQIAVLKTAIMNEGYTMFGEEDFPWQGAIDTRYVKPISTGAVKTSIVIGLHFKEDDSTFYRNLGIRVSNEDHGKNPAVQAEVERMENILYQKLLETAGTENVQRGAKEIYRSREPNVWDWKKK